ncbi:MAG: metallophosphoesterase [Acidobacteriota bacterium]|nr:metallophosphoesterase [Acidobacteriota bacterium]
MAIEDVATPEAFVDDAPEIVEPQPEPGAPSASIPPTLPVIDVHELDWQAIRSAIDPPAMRARMRTVVEQMETLLDRAGGPGLMFDSDRALATDKTICVATMDATRPLWIIGDLHGDLLALEAALAQIRDHARSANGGVPRIIFLGDFFDDEGFGLEVVLRVFELIVEAPESVCVIAGNHDEALSYDGVRFGSNISPSDFADFLNANLAHEWIERAGKLTVRLIAQAPRALFFADGLLVAHGGFPLADLHPQLAETGDWNDPACLSDFVWVRAHPKARRKMPNRFSRGSQFGYEDFAEFCALSTRLGRPVTHMVRGHDHPEDRYAIHPAYRAHPLLTTVALSRRLNREQFGPYERAPTLARVVEASLPQVYQLHIPADLIRDVFPEPERDREIDIEARGDAQP